MKAREDFVSNSSSSSFICAPEDASKIELFNTSEQLSLHQYLKQFGECDVGCSWYFSPSKNVEFVDNDTFCKMFATSIYNVLPMSAKKSYNKHGKCWDKLMPFVEDALSPVWGNSRFEYYEAEDDSFYKVLDSADDSDEDDDWDDWHDNEEHYLMKVFSSSTMKFSRVFRNH